MPKVQRKSVVSCLAFRASFNGLASGFYGGQNVIKPVVILTALISASLIQLIVCIK